jgi:hypothetical protein
MYRASGVLAQQGGSMKKAVLALLLVVPPVHAADYQQTYDRFKDTTTYTHTIKLADGMPDIDWSVDVATKGQSGFAPKDSASLKFVVSYDLSNTKALDCAVSVRSLVDGKPVEFDSAMKPMFYGGYAIATYEHKMSFAEAKAFTKAKDIEYRICGDEYKLTDAQLAEIRGFFDFAAKPIQPE